MEAAGASAPGSLAEQLLLLPPPAGILAAAATWGTILLSFWAWPWWDKAFKAEACDRSVSLLHSLVAAALGLAVEYYEPPTCEVGGGVWYRGAVQITMGFLVVDGISMLVVDVWKGWRPTDHLMLLHHSLILCGLGCGVFFDMAVWFCAANLINEGSTPFTLVFWYLNHTGQKDSKLFVVNGVVLVLTFFLFRMLFIPYSYYQFVQLDRCSGRDGLKGWLFALMTPGYACIFALNAIWFTKLVRGAAKKVCELCTGRGGSASSEAAPPYEAVSGTKD